MSEFVEATLHAQICEPVLAVLSYVNTQAALRFLLVVVIVRTAAPPAIVPSKQLLISMTFLTV